MPSCESQVSCKQGASVTRHPSSRKLLGPTATTISTSTHSGKVVPAAALATGTQLIPNGLLFLLPSVAHQLYLSTNSDWSHCMPQVRSHRLAYSHDPPPLLFSVHIKPHVLGHQLIWPGLCLIPASFVVSLDFCFSLGYMPTMLDAKRKNTDYACPSSE